MAGVTGTAREEAERLVASVLAMASQGGSSGLGDMLTGAIGRINDAVGGLTAGGQSAGSTSGSGSTSGASSAGGSGGAGGAGSTGGADKSDAAPQAGRAAPHSGFATGSPECCVCPICRAMVAMRDPNPDTAAKLAAGAGDFASGVASLMRAFNAVASATGGPASRPKAPRRPEPTPDQAWSAATRTTARSAPEPPVDERADPWGAAIQQDAAAIRAATARAEAVRAEATRAAAEELRKQAAEARQRAEQARRAVAEATAGPAGQAPGATAGAAAQAPEGVAKPAPRRPETGATRDVWAAATANSYKAGESVVAGSSAVDHDEAAPGAESSGAADDDAAQ